jgi:hypothetical protein
MSTFSWWWIERNPRRATLTCFSDIRLLMLFHYALLNMSLK